MLYVDLNDDILVPVQYKRGCYNDTKSAKWQETRLIHAFYINFKSNCISIYSDIISAVDTLNRFVSGGGQQQFPSLLITHVSRSIQLFVRNFGNMF